MIGIKRYLINSNFIIITTKLIAIGVRRGKRKGKA